MTTLRDWAAAIAEIDVHLFRIGGTQVTLFSVVELLLLILALVHVSRRLSVWVADHLLVRTHLDVGTRKSVGAIVRYIMLIVGTMAIMQTFGINLTAFTVLAGAVGVGVGFGLQQIINNFIAGLIIMFEQPIRVGGRIELNNLEGDVAEIGARRTTVVTNDNVTIIVPNSRFITENVVNLGYRREPVRVRLMVNVMAGPAAGDVAKVLHDAALAHPDVLHEPAPAVLLLSLQAGGNMGMELQVWNITRLHARDALVSELNFALASALASRGMTLA